jgi:low temperature requirement protein LtrA
MTDSTTTRRAIATTEDQGVTFVELFFDLVFVFSVTQIVGILHHGLNWISIGQSILVFWLVWWAWTQFTWALNSADTTHPRVEFGTLLATAAAFFMAIAVPEAFEGRVLWFAIAYTLVRVIGLMIYSWVTAEQDLTQRSTSQTFTLLSLSGFAAVLLGGYLGGAAQDWLWGLAILLDIFAAIYSVPKTKQGMLIYPDHFAERHGLFVIIALGESLIVAASGVAGEAWSTPLLAAAVLAVGITCGLWWSYFHQAKPALEHAFTSAQGPARGQMARDVYSLLHFPMLLGVIAFAYAVEEVVAHPDEPLSIAVRLALGFGLTLFTGGMVAALRRANGMILWSRTIILALTFAAILIVSDVTPLVTLMIVFGGIVAIALLEKRDSKKFPVLTNK